MPFDWVGSRLTLEFTVMRGQTKKTAGRMLSADHGERLQQVWKRKREEERKVEGAGVGGVDRWNRECRVNYVQCRTSKGNLQSWRNKLNDSQIQYYTVGPECRKCGKYVETGRHVALSVRVGGRWGGGGMMGDMDERGRWMQKVKDPDGDYVAELVETFFANLDIRWPATNFIYHHVPMGRPG